MADLSKYQGNPRALAFAKAGQMGKADQELNRTATRSGNPSNTNPTGQQVAPNASAKVQGALTNEIDVNEFEADKYINYNNPNQKNPFGESKTTQNPDGTITVEQKLSEGQQGILDRGTGLTQMGQDLAKGQLGSWSPFQMGQDTVGDRARIEDEVFGRLTKNVERDRARDREQLEQTLHNRGIKLDPSDPQYKSQMDALNERYDNINADARARATEMGGAEYSRSYGIGLGTHQQGMSDITQLQQQGTGLQLPQFQGYQGYNYNLSNPTEADVAFQTLAQNKKQSNAQIANMGRNRGVAGPAAPASPFNTGTPPGYGGQ